MSNLSIVIIWCATFFTLGILDGLKVKEAPYNPFPVIREMSKESARRGKLLSEVFNQPFNSKTTIFHKQVTATAYTARPEECDSTPETVALEEPSQVGMIAVSQDLETIGITLGKIIIIKGKGSFRITDRMNPRWSNRIDILHGNVKAAKLFAKQEVEIIWIE